MGVRAPPTITGSRPAGVPALLDSTSLIDTSTSPSGAHKPGIATIPSHNVQQRETRAAFRRSGLVS